jgi:hypothetical protein
MARPGSTIGGPGGILETAGSWRLSARNCGPGKGVGTLLAHSCSTTMRSAFIKASTTAWFDSRSALPFPCAHGPVAIPRARLRDRESRAPDPKRLRDTGAKAIMPGLWPHSRRLTGPLCRDGASRRTTGSLRRAWSARYTMPPWANVRPGAVLGPNVPLSGCDPVASRSGPEAIARRSTEPKHRAGLHGHRGGTGAASYRCTRTVEATMVALSPRRRAASRRCRGEPPPTERRGNGRKTGRSRGTATVRAP